MTRQDFMARLRANLAGLPPEVVEDLAADYETHFREAAAAGRSEADVAPPLGDPARLARELRAEAGLRRWEARRNPSSAMAAVFALLGLGAVDVIFLLPILVSIGGALLGFFIAALACMGVGAGLFALGPFFVSGAPVGAVMLAGLGSRGDRSLHGRDFDPPLDRLRQRPGLVRAPAPELPPARPGADGPTCNASWGDSRMTRTLGLIALVSFVLALACFAGAFAIVGGPFPSTTAGELSAGAERPPRRERRPKGVECRELLSAGARNPFRRKRRAPRGVESGGLLLPGAPRAPPGAAKTLGL